MKILCFGDSNTYGYDPRSYYGSQYGPEDRWVDILAKKLGCKVVNAGENGREIPRRSAELQRFSLMLANQKPVDLLLIMLGGNDLLQGNTVEAVVMRMTYFLKQLELEPSRILLIGPPPFQLGQWVPTEELVESSVELNHAYQSLAERLGTSYVDSGGWDLPMAFDGAHLTEQGHRRFAEELARFILSDIGKL